MRKILTVLGARPQFIKASVVSHAIRQTRHAFHEPAMASPSPVIASAAKQSSSSASITPVTGSPRRFAPRDDDGALTEVLVHTGQHFDANMSDVFFAELGMAKPDYFLDIHGGSHGAMIGRTLAEEGGCGCWWRAPTLAAAAPPRLRLDLTRRVVRYF